MRYRRLNRAELEKIPASYRLAKQLQPASRLTLNVLGSAILTVLMHPLVSIIPMAIFCGAVVTVSLNLYDRRQRLKSHLGISKEHGARLLSSISGFKAEPEIVFAVRGLSGEKTFVRVNSMPPDIELFDVVKRELFNWSTNTDLTMVLVSGERFSFDDWVAVSQSHLVDYIKSKPHGMNSSAPIDSGTIQPVVDSAGKPDPNWFQPAPQDAAIPKPPRRPQPNRTKPGPGPRLDGKPHPWFNARAKPGPKPRRRQQ